MAHITIDRLGRETHHSKGGNKMERICPSPTCGADRQELMLSLKEGEGDNYQIALCIIGNCPACKESMAVPVGKEQGN